METITIDELLASMEKVLVGRIKWVMDTAGMNLTNGECYNILVRIAERVVKREISKEPRPL